MNWLFTSNAIILVDTLRNKSYFVLKNLWGSCKLLQAHEKDEEMTCLKCGVYKVLTEKW